MRELSESQKDILAGCARGGAQILVGHPLDTLKVRLQTSASGGSAHARGTASAPAFSGMFHCLRETVRCDGVMGLYKGASSPFVGCIFYSSVLFFAWGQSTRFVRGYWNIPEQDALPIKQLVIAGMMTGGMASFVESPVDLAKSLLQTQYNARYFADGQARVHYRGLFHCATSLVRAGRIFTGLPATLMRNVPGSCAYFMSYELICQRLQTPEHREKSTVLLAGGLAGIVFWGLIFPIDVVKSRIQTDAAESGDSRRQYRDTLHCFQQIYHKHGLRGFWRGFLPCMIRAAPCNAASFLAFETIRGLL
mmetsp:Transcript_15523/g.44024  ORF Transcript_15523/g.44024 Transcript_15523/m.44024 type:complete len:307 (+) Transcript_15523:52-972(+)